MTRLFTILVEDSEAIRGSLIPVMEEDGNLNVAVAVSTANEAVQALHEHANAWQLIVIDLFLQQGTGLTVLSACRDRRPHQHAVVLSNYATTEMRRRCLEMGAEAVFDKSMEIEAFLAHCRRYADG